MTQGKTVRVERSGYHSYKLRLLQEFRDTNLSYLSKDKKDIKMFAIQFALKFVINTSCFDEEARRRAFHFEELFSKNE